MNIRYKPEGKWGINQFSDQEFPIYKQFFMGAMLVIYNYKKKTVAMKFHLKYKKNPKWQNKTQLAIELQINSCTSLYFCFDCWASASSIGHVCDQMNCVLRSKRYLLLTNKQTIKESED